MNSLDFIIKGCIKEKETHLPVSNLNVRAYDKDMLYDDLLGNATTDEKGEFAINYSEKDFRELFDNKPDIYLSVFDPLRHLVYSTQDSLRWNASEEEFFEAKRCSSGAEAKAFEIVCLEQGVARIIR